MIAVVIHGMPPDVGEEKLVNLVNELCPAVSKLTGVLEKSISVFFPPDLVKKGLGEELVAFVSGVPDGRDMRIAVAQEVDICLARFAQICVKQCRKVQVFARNRQHDGTCIRML